MLNFFTHRYFKESKRDTIFIIVATLLTLLIMAVPTGFKGSAVAANAVRARVRIIEVNNDRQKIIGPVRQGEQQLEVEILSGRFKNQIYSSSNNMMGKMEIDKFFVEGDIAFAVLNLTEDGKVAHVQIIDHYRTNKTILLCAVFIGITVLIMGWMGIKILSPLSFPRLPLSAYSIR